MVRADRLPPWLSAAPKREMIERQGDGIYLSCREYGETRLGFVLSATPAG